MNAPTVKAPVLSLLLMSCFLIGCGGPFVKYRLLEMEPGQLSERDSVRVYIYDEYQRPRFMYYRLVEEDKSLYVKLDEKVLKQHFDLDRVDSLKLDVRSVKNPEILYRRPDSSLVWEAVTLEKFTTVCDSVYEELETKGCPLSRRAKIYGTGEKWIFPRSTADRKGATKDYSIQLYPAPDSAATGCRCDRVIPPKPDVIPPRP